MKTEAYVDSRILFSVLAKHRNTAKYQLQYSVLE